MDHTLDDKLEVADGYQTHVLIRWGAPLFEGMDAFDPTKQTGDDQLKRFGYNHQTGRIFV